jgi:uncharacterized protein YdhG (YjbR/CyaY superfamily)
MVESLFPTLRAASTPERRPESLFARRSPVYTQFARRHGAHHMKKQSAVPKTVNEYLAAVPEPARSTLKKVRAAIRSAAPAEATEVISYGMPMFKYKGMLMGYAAYRKHCSLFLATSSLLEKFKSELSRYQTSKGTIRFPIDQPLPASLVKKIVKARVAQNGQKQDR